MKALTKAEEQIMQILWDLKEAYVKDVLERMEDPKPAYNTVSTFIRILETKGFVKHRPIGKSHQYYPIVTKDEYRSFSIRRLLSGYFGGSFTKMASFFAKEENLDVKEIERIMEEVKKDVK